MGKSISFWMRKQANIFFIKGAREKVYSVFLSGLHLSGT